MTEIKINPVIIIRPTPMTPAITTEPIIRIPMTSQKITSVTPPTNSMTVKSIPRIAINPTSSDSTPIKIKPNPIKIKLASTNPTDTTPVSPISSTSTSIKSISVAQTSAQSLSEKYRSQKPTPIYKLPTTRIKIMKGEFFYNFQTKNYRRDPTGWWFSEKLDGVHGIWTGAEMLSRTGNKIIVPDWWSEQLPKNMALVGELFVSRKNFSEIQGLVHSKIPVSRAWQKVSFCLFDIPDSRLSFRENYQIMQELISTTSCSFLKLIPQTTITNLEHLLQIHKQLVIQGAEGSIIRDPNAGYLPYQTDRLLKFKSQIGSDGEFLHLFDDLAVIVGYNLSDKLLKADGKPALKSLQVEWLEEPLDSTEELIEPSKESIDSPTKESKVQFSVSGHLTKIEKCGDYQNLFPKGAQIRVLYNELNESGKPRFPRYGGMV